MCVCVYIYIYRNLKSGWPEVNGGCGWIPRWESAPETSAPNARSCGVKQCTVSALKLRVRALQLRSTRNLKLMVAAVAEYRGGNPRRRQVHPTPVAAWHGFGLGLGLGLPRSNTKLLQLRSTRNQELRGGCGWILRWESAPETSAPDARNCRAIQRKVSALGG